MFETKYCGSSLVVGTGASGVERATGVAAVGCANDGGAGSRAPRTGTAGNSPAAVTMAAAFRNRRRELAWLGTGRLYPARRAKVSLLARKLVVWRQCWRIISLRLGQRSACVSDA